ncbi:MAG TPA: TerB family tellurite resistance protein [Elainellaceae cyanobacterium]
MTLQPPPPPPSITPRQMNLLRIVASMAWADGGLAEEESNLMLDRFSQLFSKDSDQQAHLRHELQDYLMQNIPLDELTPKLQSTREKELVLRLGYEVICVSSRTPEESKINEEEAAAYQKLVQLLDLPAETVKQIEEQSDASPDKSENVVDTVIRELREFFQS